MRRSLLVTLLGLVDCFLLVTTFPGDANSQPGAKKLPTFWQKLKLTKDQEEKDYKIQDEYQAKID